jgi:hypothetical protein
MALGTIASKTYGTALEEDRFLLLEPCVAYQRLTGLAEGWRRARIAAVMSFVGLTGPDVLPVNENAISPWTPASLFLIGLSDGQGLPGQAGVKFVGATMCSLYYGAIARLRVLEDGTARLVRESSAFAHSPGGILFSGAATESASTSTYFYGDHKPASSEEFCFRATVDLTLNSNNTLQLGYQSASGVTNPMLGLSAAIAAGKSDLDAINGGWWDADGNSGCRHLFIRCPFQQNRLRIHALRVMQLA